MERSGKILRESEGVCFRINGFLFELGKNQKQWEINRVVPFKNFVEFDEFFKNFFGEHKTFCGATDTSVLEFC